LLIFKNRIISVLAGCILFTVAAVSVNGQGKPPIILIPGLTGSELVNTRTGKKVWFKTRRSRTDDMKLPISPNIAANRDGLSAGDIIRDVKFALRRTDVYGGLLEALQKAGYREARWDSPGKRGYEDTVYVFPYDWRRDNVETARLLMRKIEALKRRLRRPNLTFDIIGHSMGGLIARYAAMYGNADLPPNGRAPQPTWAGAKSIGKIILLGTPNQGTALALREMINGSDLVGVGFNLPFVQRFSRYDVFTIPTAFELLPAPGTFKVYDENLNPIDVDLYDPAAWAKYGWSPIGDKDFDKHFTPVEQRNANAYLSVILNRAKRLHEALNAGWGSKSVSLYVIGSQCKDTLNSMVLFREKDGSWKTLAKADSYTTSDGRKISSEELKSVIYAPGDGVVTGGSLMPELFLPKEASGNGSAAIPATYICENHDALPGNAEIQARILAILSGAK
jgi:pimeloyl-ACP methyl ester carboxylesterase